jgi:hypothetical protein
MARVRTVDFLPEIFQTSTNRQFLSATLDQLVQEPAFKKIQGYVGRRTGPGVNTNDSYVTETTPGRRDYQLEPGVVVKDPIDNTTIDDVITYPGINAALNLQGADSTHPDKLYNSDYYTWDPFIDFDKFVNFSQYYWLSAGPDPVSVFAETVPSTNNFTVTRSNGVYTFTDEQGNNPTITLVRGGSYTFNVAQNNKETINFRVSNYNNSYYIVDYANNPTLTLVRGNTYIFTLVLKDPYPFYIKTEPTLGTTNQYTNGVTNNGAVTGTVIFTVPQDAPDTLYYVNSTQPNLQGTINVVNATPGTGPGFWFQSTPGVTGRLPYAPNISSRDVLGVANNGEDLGTITFDVPEKDAQDYYYSLPTFGTNVDLITNLQFDQINNQPLETFLQTHGGIDGISALDGRTLVFQQQDSGWDINVIGSGFGNGFDSSIPVDPSQYYGLWQISINNISGVDYIQLVYFQAIPTESKFSIRFGTEYASTSWYKNISEYFSQIPLLTAILDTLYYQDATDPLMFGKITLIEQSADNTLDVNDILGKKAYTSPNGVVFTNGLKVQLIGSVTPASYQGNTYYVEGVGTGIKLLPTTNFVTPETYTNSETVPYDSLAYDVGNYDASLNQPLEQDYLTINRASLDLNPWTRSNRWFHVDVINATATYNETIADLDNIKRAKRPIIEFRAGTRLFNFGTEGKQPVDIIDFNETDALSNINGSTGYGVDGYTFISGSRVIFAADLDPQVRNKVYVVEFISPDTELPLIDEPIINLVPADDTTVLANQTVVCLSGITQQGQSFWFDGVNWTSSQQKISVNQAPLFDVYDSDGYSFGDLIKYPSSNFVGSKLFSYATGTGRADSILNFPLKYLSISNVGDIVFDNNLYVDEFTYTKESVSTTDPISLGFVREYNSRLEYVREIGWQNAVVKSQQRQQFTFTYDGSPLLLDVKVNNDLPVPPILMYIGSQFISPDDYTFTTTADSTTIRLSKIYMIGDIIEVDVISDQASKFAFYQVPVNLENNPLNENSEYFTLGTVRAHYETIGENLRNLVGPINGSNNSRDLGNIIPYGTNILQQSSPLTLAGYFMRTPEYNIFSSLEYNSREYEKFKAQLLDTAVRNDYTNYTTPEALTNIISDINTGRTSVNPFYWSDMLPAGNVYTQRQITYTSISTPTFDLSTTYDFTSSNYQGLLIYINNNLLTINYDYTVSPDSPQLTITVPLSVGDVVTIQEYLTTYGNFVPNTPTKLGMWPAYRPHIYLDTTYVTPTFIILGHDGSKTVAFGDFRDSILLEFETRIFNNLKIKSEVPLSATDVIPGQFRTTDYSLSEVNQILSQDFLSWVGWNKLNYQQQDYNADNSFTWNYSACGNLLSDPTNFANETLLPAGAWRGLYQYFYDTIDPSATPWEMLGFTEEPTWWEDVYGPAPYTRDNLVLWDDLAQGRVADPAGEYFKPEYARPGLDGAIPVNSEGQLLSPFDCVVGAYDSSQFRKSWTFGDNGPTEYAWRSSSSYPFAVMRLLSLTRSAQFFSLFVDRDLYKFNPELDQYLYNDRYRLNPTGVQIYGNGISKASYINWIIDYNQQLGINSTTALTTDLSNLDVRLCYRMGGFSDKDNLKIYVEKSGPNSLNSSLLIPDDSYDLLLYKNQAFNRVNYSSVIVQRVATGYAVIGYGITQPYFEILASRPAGVKTIISAGGTTVSVPSQYSQNVVQVPYGYVFTNVTMVCDFLLSYGALLESQGLSFTDRENGKTLNWLQMAQEFLYWCNQGWAVGSVINLNPTATSLTLTAPGAVIDNVSAQTAENIILDQNRLSLPVRDLVVERIENSFKISSITGQTINYINLQYTNYESLVILNNVSLFNDLLYDPTTGARQSRINIAAAISADWNGQLDAQGFILNNPSTIKNWEPNKKYAKGEIVIYKNNYWSAQAIVQPRVEFNYSEWVKSDYTKIQTGLLENIANKANQLANSYNTNSANLENDQDLLAYGLIGFRPRQYMASLNLDDVSQVNVYQQFLKDKGTIRSVRLLANANLGKEVAEYDVYENWAIQQGTYGANANRSFVELQLNEALLDADPALIQIIEPEQQSLADQTVLLNDVWRESYKLTSNNIFPTIYSAQDVDTALPSAGYVNLDDVDITVFSLQGNLQLAPGVIDTIGIGTTVWAAKINDYNWGIYRCNGVSGYINVIVNNLDATSTVGFSQSHNLVKNDIIIIRFLNDANLSAAVNGVYRVLAVPNATQIVIELNLSSDVVGGNSGLCYRLQTMRVAQPSDVLHLPYVNELIPGARAWIDNTNQGRWEVIEKTNPFGSDLVLPSGTPIPNSGYGSSIAQAPSNIIALVGAPDYLGLGAVYPYVKDDKNQYQESSILILGATGTQGYGRQIVMGNETWSVAGASQSNGNRGYACVIYRAPATNVFEQKQLLVAPDQDFGALEFGHSVTVSFDEKWMYIGAPGPSGDAPGGKIYAYGLVDVQTQEKLYITDGVNRIFDYSEYIIIDYSQPAQLNVTLNNRLLDYGLDYTITDTQVVIIDTPSAGQKLLISRNTSHQLDRQIYHDVEQDSTSGSGTGALFTVDNIRGIYYPTATSAGQNYIVGDTITIDGTAIGVDYSEPTLPSSPTNDLVLTVTMVNGSGGVVEFTSSGSGVDDNTIFPLDPFIPTASDIYSFTVYVDGIIQRPHIDYDFNTDSTDALAVVFNTVPVAGATIAVQSGSYWQYVDTILVDGLDLDARLGSSVDTFASGRQVVAGAINASSDEDHPQSGAVYVFDRGVTKYIISNTSTTTYALPAGWKAPVAVILNGQRLKNSAQYTTGQFAVVGNNVVLDSELTLNVGDILEIENNIFQLVQKLTANAPFDESLFGYSLALSPNSDEIYIGSPRDGTVLVGAGSVEAFAEQGLNYGVLTATVANPALTPGDTLRINNINVAVPPGGTVGGLASTINAANIPNVVASVANGYLTLSIGNKQASIEGEYLSVLPGFVGTAFEGLGFEPWAWTQTITSPNPQEFAEFGSAISLDAERSGMIIGAPGGNTYEPVTFDNGTTYFDDRSTNLSTVVVQSGAVYTYDYLESTNSSVTNPGHWVFGQQVYDLSISPLDQWGAAVNYVSGRLLIGSPGNDLNDSALNYGRVAQFTNANLGPSWVPIHIQQPVVDVHLLNSVYMYDRLKTSKSQFFDFINPLQGKILGAARQNIDYINAIDPAKYNVGAVNNNGNFWGEDHIGQIWWDISSARFIDPNQDDIVYASRRWGQLFPGSKVEIYQWTASSVPPAQYSGAGVPWSTTSYVVTSKLNQQGVFTTTYYFWVTNIDTINTRAGKTLSTTGIARYIESPRSSGIPYIAAIDASTIAIYNGLDYISAQDTILHVEYDRELTDDNIHVEYELIAEEDPDSFISGGLYRKLQDSFCGVNSVGAKVPDTTLSVAEQYGIQFRPRQSMFVDRYAALENYLVRANSVLKNYPIVETRTFTLLNSSEPEPTASSGEWNKRLVNIEELSYQNLYSVPLGYKYLIVSDSTNAGLWTIYTVVGTAIGGRIAQLSRVQNYDTRKFWNHIDWYLPGYNSSIRPVAEVPNYAALASLTVPVGSSVKVTANAQGKFEIYLRTDIGWDRVGLEDGTIEFSETLWDYQIGKFGFDVEVFDAQYFDQEPVIETRKIIQAINEELFVGDLLIERNRSLILMFNFILSEFQAPEWLTKTSLIDVVHKIRQLLPFQIYRQDNQDFVLDYIQEVKPYHTQIKTFNLSYDGNDSYPGVISDFDVPAYFNLDLTVPQYVSPVLLPYTKSTAVGTGTPNDTADTASDAEIWTQVPWQQWYNNYLLDLNDVLVENGGTGYTGNISLTVVGECTTPANLTPIVNSAGNIVAITINDPGAGYKGTPTISITSDTGSGAILYPVMGNELVRSFKTVIKYDRYQYNSTIIDWEPDVAYENGTQVRYLNQVWQANSDDSSSVESTTFDPQQWVLVDASSLNGLDRTQGYYTPTANEPGLELPLLIDGLDYPGVQVYGPDFNQNTGFDIGNYDINPYDNIAYSAEGTPTYDPAILDAIYESEYLDIYLGTRSTDINVDGGAYVDTYESHAPEELVPGIEFDTLDLRVYTRPGSDWALDGHGFPVYMYNVEVTVVPATYDFSIWADAIPYLTTGILTNRTTGLDLAQGVDYTVDWVNQTFTVTSGITVGDVLAGSAYGLGGGNQLYQNIFNGADVGNSITIPVAYDQVQEVAVFANGTFVSGPGLTESSDGKAIISFPTTYTSTDVVVIYALGPTNINGTLIDYSWSAPQTEYFTGNGFNTEFTVTNTLEYTNSVNMIVTVNGSRVRTAAGVEYIADGSSGYLLPDRLGFSQSLIADTEVLVYLDNELQILGVDYFVDPWAGDPRYVNFYTGPEIGQTVYIAVITNTDAYINNNQLVFTSAPALGDVIAITSWNDTRQQQIVTTVIEGPTTIGMSTVNDIMLTRPVTDPSRLWVTLNGERLFYGDDFVIENQELVLLSGLMDPSDLFMVTEVTNSVVPGELVFRIFQDMRGAQATYRITTNTTTTVAQPVSITDDIIYVDSVSGLTDPNPANNIWGVVTINGERIMYRERDSVANTISSLLRGTAGTSITAHSTGSQVYNMNRGNLLPEEFQDRLVTNTFIGDSSTTTYTTDITIDNAPQVFVGGSIVVSDNMVDLDPADYTVVQYDPVVVSINDIPSAGNIVSVTVTQLDSTETTQLFTSTGSSGRFQTSITDEFFEQSTASYSVTDLDPVTVNFNSALPAGWIVHIVDNQGVNNNTVYQTSNGIDTTFTSDLDLTQPVLVYVGGTLVDRSTYTVTSIAPIAVEFITAPMVNLEVTVAIRQGVSWYAPGINTPSDGVALQDTNTNAARFLRGVS